MSNEKIQDRGIRKIESGDNQEINPGLITGFRIISYDTNKEIISYDDK